MRSSYGISIGSILHLTDFSHGSHVAYAHALKIAVAVKGSLELLHVRREEEPSGWDRYPAIRSTLSDWKLLPADAKRSDVARLGVHITKSVCEAKETVSGVLEHLQRHSADLVVMATHRRGGLDRWLHSGVAESLTAQADSGALLVPYDVDGFVNPDSGKVSLKRVLIPVDMSPDPQPAIDAVVDLTEAIAPGDVEVRLLHVGDPAAAPSPDLPGSDCCVWTRVRREGGVVEEICRDAEENDVDLIAMTTNGHDGFLDVLRGSTTERVLQQATCPILSVHSADR